MSAQGNTAAAGEARVADRQQVRNKLVGTYRLISYKRTVPGTDISEDLLGKAPQGYIIYTGNGRMMAIIAKDERPKPKDLATITDKERADLFKTMNAYSGTYDFDGQKVTHHIDLSSNELWTGTDVVRNVTLDGRKAVYSTVPAQRPADV